MIEKSYYFGEEGDLGLKNGCSRAVVMNVMIFITLFNIFVLPVRLLGVSLTILQNYE